MGTAIGAIILVLVYFAPALVAHFNKRKNETAITVLNLFLGWTVLGWVIALIWATMEDK